MGSVASHVDIDVNVVTKVLDEWYSACRCPETHLGGNEVVVEAVKACQSPDASSSRRARDAKHFETPTPIGVPGWTHSKFFNY